jgi:hypothetical protein
MFMFPAYDLVTTSITVRGSWPKAGYEFARRNQTHYLWVGEVKIRNSHELLKTWHIDDG